MAYFGVIYFAAMEGGGCRNYLHIFDLWHFSFLKLCLPLDAGAFSRLSLSLSICLGFFIYWLRSVAKDQTQKGAL